MNEDETWDEFHRAEEANRLSPQQVLAEVQHRLDAMDHNPGLPDEEFQQRVIADLIVCVGALVNVVLKALSQ